MAPPAEIVMPKLGLTMTEGLIAEWHVQPGTRVAPGDVLFVVETEKIATDIEAPDAGEITEILTPAGASVAVGTPVARWTGATLTEPALSPSTPVTPATSASAARIIATPLARRLARARGITLAALTGSGPRGRIKARDVPPAAPGSAAPVAETAAGEVIPLDHVRAAAARRLTQAKQDIPHFYVGAAAEIARLLTLAEEWRSLPGTPRLTLTHWVLAAIGRALIAMPEINRVWEGEGWRYLASPDIGLAVDTPRGIFAPVLHAAGHLALDALAHQTHALVARARAGKLTPDELRGGSITLSNVGMHGARFLMPIVNPGQSMVLGLGAMEQLFRPDAAGAPRLCREVTLVLAADHRVFDGVAASAFLARIIAFLQQPLALLLAPNIGSP